MDVLALIVACSVYPDQSVVRAMVELASRGNASFVGDLATFDTYDSLTTRRQAERLLTALERRGGRPVLGLLGLPPAWAQRYARDRRDLFDPCVNLWIGTAVLSGHHDACVTSHAAIFMVDGAPMASPPPSPPPAPPAARAWANVTAPPSPPRPSRPPPLESEGPANNIRACTLSRFAHELGVAGYADAVMNLVPQHRRLFALPAPEPTPELISPPSAPPFSPWPSERPPRRPAAGKTSATTAIATPSTRTAPTPPLATPETAPILD